MSTNFNFTGQQPIYMSQVTNQSSLSAIALENANLKKSNQILQERLNYLTTSLEQGKQFSSTNTLIDVKSFIENVILFYFFFLFL